MVTHELNTNQPELIDEVIVFVGFVVLVFFGFGMGGFLGSVYVWGVRTRVALIPRSLEQITIIGSSLWMLLLVAWMVVIGGISLSLYWSVLSFPLVGLGGVVVWAFDFFRGIFRRPPSWDEHLKRLDAVQQTEEEKQVQQLLTAGTPVQSQLLELGILKRGDGFVERGRIQAKRGYLWFDERLIDHHILMVGQPGSGKTEALKRIIYEIVSKTGRDIYVVDGKGDPGFAEDIRSIIYTVRGDVIPVFHMGNGQKGALYNGFQGSDEAIKERLKAMFQVENKEGGAEFYANVSRSLLNLICMAPQGAPRSLEELDDRMSLEWIASAYQGQPKMKAVSRYREHFDGFRTRADSLIWEYEQYFSSDGFSLESVPGAIFSLKTAAVGDLARRYLDYLVEDFKDWVGNRQTGKAVLIIDEFGQFNQESITALIELARSAGLGVILATQDLATIKDERVRDQILASSGTKILMKSDTPELVGDLGGTRTKPHLTYQTGEDGLTGTGSIRLEEERRVDLNAIRRFKPGEAYIIDSGQAGVIVFRQVEKFEQAPEYEMPTLSTPQLPSGIESQVEQSEEDTPTHKKTRRGGKKHKPNRPDL